jgi:hypothetical protein
MSDSDSTKRLSPTLRRVIESAARLQQAVPDAVLVGGSAAALYAGHRESFDHDHVIEDLSTRYEQILDAVEATEGWVTSVRASRPPFTLMGSLGGVEAGLRQLRRTRPLEVTEVPAVGMLRVPTDQEMLRVKSYLVVQRNQVRDYLDVVALAEIVNDAPSVLAGIDAYYDDRSNGEDSVLTALIQRLSEPNPRDREVTRELSEYKGLDPRWHKWATVVAACEDLADAIVGTLE